MPSSARVAMTDPTPGQPDGGAFRGGRAVAGVPITTALRSENRVLVCPPGALVCPGRTPLCVLGGPLCPGPGRRESGSAPATAGRGDLDDRVRRQQQVAEQRVCRGTPNAPDISRAFRFCLNRARPEGFEPPTF
jgi:hypothetical protein